MNAASREPKDFENRKENRTLKKKFVQNLNKKKSKIDTQNLFFLKLHSNFIIILLDSRSEQKSNFVIKKKTSKIAVERVECSVT